MISEPKQSSSFTQRAIIFELLKRQPTTKYLLKKITALNYATTKTTIETEITRLQKEKCIIKNPKTKLIYLNMNHEFAIAMMYHEFQLLMKMFNLSHKDKKEVKKLLYETAILSNIIKMIDEAKDFNQYQLRCANLYHRLTSGDTLSLQENDTIDFADEVKHDIRNKLQSLLSENQQIIQKYTNPNSQGLQQP